MEHHAFPVSSALHAISTRPESTLPNCQSNVFDFLAVVHISHKTQH